MDEKLRARLIAIRDQLPPGVAAELAPEKPGRGVMMASLYLLGASYYQTATLFGVSKPTVVQAVRVHLSPKLRQARPHYQSKPAISYEQADVYYNAILRANGKSVLAVISNVTHAKLEPEDENE